MNRRESVNQIPDPMELLFIDCEFDGFNGALISMGIVTSTGREFYEVINKEISNPWVIQNVVPLLRKESVSHKEFSGRLEMFLPRTDEFCVIADWPEDIMHFCREVIVGPGLMMRIPSFNTEICRWIDAGSTAQHNALEDAKGIRDVYYRRYYPRLSKA